MSGVLRVIGGQDDDEEGARRDGRLAWRHGGIPRSPPITDKTPVVTLLEGGTPLVRPRGCPSASAREVWLKVEGANPTGSFKDRGMTMAITMAVDEGAKAVVCASTGNTSASAAAYAARAGLACVVVIPEGQIALGKLAQALMHGARVLQVAGTSTSAHDRARPAEHAPVTVVNSVNPYRIEGQMTGRLRDRRRPGRRPRRPVHPGGQRREHHGLLAGFPTTRTRAARHAAAHLGFQAAGAAPIVLGHPVEHPETIATAIRIGNPASWHGRGRRVRVRRPSRPSPTTRSWTRTPSRPEESVFCEPASAASVAGLLSTARPGLDRGVCPHGHGLKDPDLAIKAISVPSVIDLKLESVLAEISL